MSDVLRFGKKLFTWSVVAMTIAWSIGLAAVLPTSVSAATVADVEAGDLIKLADQTSVYYVNEDMERMYFAFGWLYKTWFADYSAIKTLPAGTDLDENFPPASRGAVSVRPGSCELLKSPASPAVYAISYGGVRHKIGSEAAAVALCGSTWAQHVHDLPDFVISLFPIGGELDGTMPFPGQLIRSTANGPVYVVGSDSKAYEVSGTLPAYLASDVRLVTQAQWDALAGMGSGTRTVASLTADVAQLPSNPNDPTDPTDPSLTGDLKISLAGNTPEADVVPGGAQNVPYLGVVLTAQSGDVKVEAITFNLGGVGDEADFDKVYLYNDNTRVDNGRSLNNDGEVTFNVDMTIQKGESETLWVKADMETVAGPATDGDQNRFEIRTAADIDASGDVTGSFPLRGNLLVIGSQDIGVATLEAGGTSTTAKIGEDEVLVGEFDVEVSGDDVNVTGLTLEQKGTINTDALSNFVMKRDGNVVAEGVVDGDRVSFEFEEANRIEDGDTETFKVYADIGIADVDDTIQFVLDEDSDFSAFSEDNTGFEVGVTNGSLDSGDAMKLTVEGGKINVDFDGESTDVRQDQNNAVFGTFTILSTAEDLDFDQMDFTLVKTAGTPAPEDMKLRDKNGHGVFSLDAVSTITEVGTGGTVRVENLVLTKGILYEFDVVGDVIASSTDASTYHFTWAASAAIGEGSTSGNAVSADDFSSSALTGPTVTVDTASLVIRSSALSDNSVVNGTKNVLLFRGTLEAGSTSDVTLDSMTFEKGGGAAWSGLIDGLKLYIVDGDENVDTTKAPLDTDNTVTGDEAIFDGLDFVIPSGSTGRMKFEVYADITDGSNTGSVDVSLRSVEAHDVDGEDVTAKNSSNVTIANGAELTTDRDVTITGTGTLTMVMDTDYAGLRVDTLALAGSNKYLIGRTKIQSDFEDVVVRDLSIHFVTSTQVGNTTGTIANLDNTIDSVSVYSDPAMTDLLSTADFAATTTFDGVDFTVEDGATEYLYFGVKLNSLGNGEDATAVPSSTFSIEMADDLIVTGLSTTTLYDIRGASSSDDIDPTVTLTNSKEVSVAPVKITAWSDFANAHLGGGPQDIFTFKVKADAGVNKTTRGQALNAELQRVELRLSSDLGTNTAFSNIQLCRVDGTDACLALAIATYVNNDGLSASTSTVELITSGDNYVDLTGFATDDDVIDSGETVEYVVRATINSADDSYVSLYIDDVNSQGLVYGVDLQGDGAIDGGEDYQSFDIRKDEPRGSQYPDVKAGGLSN